MIKFGLISRVYQSKLSPLEGHARAEWRFGAWTRTGMEQKKKTEQDERGERDVHGREKRLSRTLTMIFNADFKHHLCQTGFCFYFFEEMPSAGDAGVLWAAHRWHLPSFGGDVLCYILA